MKGAGYKRGMLRCVHKDVLLELAREHEKSLRHAYALARRHLGDHHVNVGVLQDRVMLAAEVVRHLEAEPVRAAA